MALWNALLQIREVLLNLQDNPNSISINLAEREEVIINNESLNDDIIIHCNDRFTGDNPLNDHNNLFIEVRNNTAISSVELKMLEMYLPYACLGFFGKRHNKCFAISHFAQTLDGRIATLTGDSKWIGNDENLLHAHRMRALCDAILVGVKTLETDNPQLNVRKVPGPDPIRVIIGGNGQLCSERFHAVDSNTIVFKESKNGLEPFESILIHKEPQFDLKSVLGVLADKGIYSVYIEGGSYTTSSFLEQKALDQVQIHFSGKILGSGTNSFAFGNIGEIKDAVTFSNGRFIPMGDEMMYIGNL